MTRSLALYLLASFLGLNAADAALIYDHGAPNQAGGYDITGSEQADNFILSPGQSVAAVRFWALLANPADFNGSLSYKIYDDGASGAPGNILGSGSVTAAATPTGLSSVSGVPEYVVQFNLASPVSYSPGISYYLSLHEGSYNVSDGTTTFWETSGSGLHFAQLNSVPGNPAEPQVQNELAFQLFDAPFASTPEPGSIVLVIAGLAAIRAAALKSSRYR